MNLQRDVRRRNRIFWGLLVVVLSLGIVAAKIVLTPSRPQHVEPPPRAVENAQAQETPREPDLPRKLVTAAWYPVPADSLARRRAGVEELTAAHNSLPLGTRLRLTRRENGKSVIVRITDRGIHDHRIKLDICKEAAEELEMVEKGIAKLEMQILPNDGKSAPETPAVIAGGR